MPSIARCPACNAWIGAPERPVDGSHGNERRGAHDQATPAATGIIRCPVCQTSQCIEDLPWEEIPACGVVGSQLQVAAPTGGSDRGSEAAALATHRPATTDASPASGELLDSRASTRASGNGSGGAIWEDLQEAIDSGPAADPGIRVWIPSAPQPNPPTPASKHSSPGQVSAMQETLVNYPSKRSSGNLTLDFLRFRDQPNRWVEFGKILAGGVAGVMLSQVILWWLPGRWQRDPLDLAPRVPRPLRFLVPENLRAMSDRPSARHRGLVPAPTNEGEGADMPEPSADSPRPSLQALDAQPSDDPFAMSTVRDGIAIERPGDSRLVLRALRTELQSPEWLRLTQFVGQSLTQMPRPLAQVGQDLWVHDLLSSGRVTDLPADVPLLSEAAPRVTAVATYLEAPTAGPVRLPAPARAILGNLVEHAARHEGHWRMLQSILATLPPLRPIDALETVVAADSSLLGQPRPCCGLWEDPAPPRADAFRPVGAAPESCWSLAAATPELDLHLNLSDTPGRFHPMTATLVHPPLFAGVATPAFHLADHTTLRTSVRSKP